MNWENVVLTTRHDNYRTEYLISKCAIVFAMSDDETAELVRKHLVVDTSQIISDIIVRAKSILMLDAGGGIHLRDATRHLPQRDLMLTFLLGRKLAFLGGLSSATSASVEELTRFSGASGPVVRARLADFKKEGKVESSERGTWSLKDARLNDVIVELETVAKGDGN